MIIVVCTDDPTLMGVAHASAAAHPAVFGAVHRIYTHAIPKVRVNEDLFLLAHGAYDGDGGNPVIGDSQQAFYVNGIELYLNIKGILPHDYRGRVYIDACESADHVHATFSFAEVFYSQLVEYPQVQVFGRNGKVGGQVPTPQAGGWVRAGDVVQAGGSPPSVG